MRTKTNELIEISILIVFTSLMLETAQGDTFFSDNNASNNIADSAYCCKSVCVAGNLENNIQSSLLENLSSPIIFEGDENIAYRDPAVLYYQKQFYLFFTIVEIEPDGKIFSYTAMSRSSDLADWSEIKKITPRNQSLNFSSPGNVIKYGEQFILCMQTYPRLNYTKDQMPHYADDNARIYIMRSNDLITWREPELLRVKGNDVPVENMGRMIDPYLLEDKNEPGKWWCFFDTNGTNMSYSYDLKDWTYTGYVESGENASLLIENDEYILFHSPKNGIDIKKSNDLINWKSYGHLIKLGQKDWKWAKGRITAGTVINLKEAAGIGKYLMFFHGSGPLTEKEGDFDKNASIGIAWSEDLIIWNWPGKNEL